MATLRPLQNRIVIKQHETKKAESSILVIPDVVGKEPPTRGEVIAVGPGKYDKGVLIPMVVKVGDSVLFPKGAGAAVVVDGQAYTVLYEDDIMAIVN